MSKVLLADFGDGLVEICRVAGHYGLTECRALIVNGRAQRVQVRTADSGSILFEAFRTEGSTQFGWRTAGMASAFAPLSDSAPVVR